MLALVRFYFDVGEAEVPPSLRDALNELRGRAGHFVENVFGAFVTSAVIPAYCRSLYKRGGAIGADAVPLVDHAAMIARLWQEPLRRLRRRVLTTAMSRFASELRAAGMETAWLCFAREIPPLPF
eukprot:Opistho-1_new@107043